MKKTSEIVICYTCKGSGDGPHNEGICKTCEGSGRLKQVVTYEKYKSVADEALKAMNDEDIDDVELECDADAEEEFKKALYDALIAAGIKHKH